VSVEFGRRLLLSGAVGQAEIQAALLRHLAGGTPFIRALLEIGGVSERAIEEELMRSPAPVLDVVVPLPSVVDQLPEGLCRRLLAVPVRRDDRSGLVDVAVVDPYDPHAADEIAFHLKTEVRILRARLSTVDEALARIEQGVYSDKVIVRKSEPPPAPRSPSGPPIPLVRKSARAGEGFVGGRSVSPSDDDETIEVLGVRDIVEQMDGDGTVTDDLGQPVMPLTTSKVPRAPGLPSFGNEEPKPKKVDTVPPATSRGPFSPKAPVPPFADIEGVLAAIDKARTRDEVIDNLIAGMSTVARRVGAFAVKKRGFRGLACNSDLGEPKGFREIEIPTDAPTVLGIATSKGSYLGPLPATPPHEALLRFMQGSSGEVAAVLVSVAGRPAVVLFADQLGDTMIATRRAEQLGKEASRAFSRILTDAKSDRRSGA
jgi:hypothetical protein